MVSVQALRKALATGWTRSWAMALWMAPGSLSYPILSRRCTRGIFRATGCTIGSFAELVPKSPHARISSGDRVGPSMDVNAEPILSPRTSPLASPQVTLRGKDAMHRAVLWEHPSVPSLDLRNALGIWSGGRAQQMPSVLSALLSG